MSPSVNPVTTNNAPRPTPRKLSTIASSTPGRRGFGSLEERRTWVNGLNVGDKFEQAVVERIVPNKVGDGYMGVTVWLDREAPQPALLHRGSLNLHDPDTYLAELESKLSTMDEVSIPVQIKKFDTVDTSPKVLLKLPPSATAAINLEFLSRYQPGDTLKGDVVEAPYGLFIVGGGVKALLHHSQSSLGRLAEIASQETAELVVLGVDEERNRLRLTDRLTPDNVRLLHATHAVVATNGFASSLTEADIHCVNGENVTVRYAGVLCNVKVTEPLKVLERKLWIRILSVDLVNVAITAEWSGSGNSAGRSND